MNLNIWFYLLENLSLNLNKCFKGLSQAEVIVQNNLKCCNHEASNKFNSQVAYSNAVFIKRF